MYDSLLLEESEKAEGEIHPPSSFNNDLQYHDPTISRSFFIKAHLDKPNDDHLPSSPASSSSLSMIGDSGSSLNDYYDFLTTEDDTTEEEDSSSSNLYSSSGGGGNPFSFGSNPSSPSAVKIDLYSNSLKSSSSSTRSSNPSILPSNHDGGVGSGSGNNISTSTQNNEEDNNNNNNKNKKIEVNNAALPSSPISPSSSSSSQRKKKKKKKERKHKRENEYEMIDDTSDEEDLLHSSDIFSSFNINRVYTDDDDDHRKKKNNNNNNNKKNGTSMEKFPINSIRTLHLNRKLSFWLTRPYVIKLFCYYFTIAFWINLMTFYIPGIIPYQAGGCTFFYSLWNSFFLIFPAFGSFIHLHHPIMINYNNMNRVINCDSSNVSHIPN